MRRSYTNSMGLKTFNFNICLLLRRSEPYPSRSRLLSGLSACSGDVSCLKYSRKGSTFSVKGRSGAAALSIRGTAEDEFGIAKQLHRWWIETPEQTELLNRCGYRVNALIDDGGSMEPEELAELITDVTAALLKLWPSAEAVFFPETGRITERDEFLLNGDNLENSSTLFAVDVLTCRHTIKPGLRFRTLESIGMYTLGLPDAAYIFLSYA